MKRAKYVFLLLAVFILIAIGIFITNDRNPIKQNNQNSNNEDTVKVLKVIRGKITSQNLKVQDSIFVHNAKRVIIPSSWKTYTNKQYGFTFQYPGTWSKYGEENNIVNRLGSIVAIEVNFIDSLTSSTLLVSYHLPPEGKELYQYAISQYKSSQGWYERGGRLLVVAGNNAVEAFTKMSISGRGTALNPALRLILVDFLDKQQTGAIELQFKTPLPNDSFEVAKFERLLSTFKFSE
jgi:hypothetical protein